MLAVLAAAVERGNPATRNPWFDVASLAERDIRPQAAALLVKTRRQIGMAQIAADLAPYFE